MDYHNIKILVVEYEQSYYLIKSECLPEELIQKIKITLCVFETGNIRK